jgi:exosortase
MVSYQPTNPMASESKSISGERSALREALVLWSSLPDKLLFFTLCVVWALFFHFLGNSTFGYKDTPSLFGWMQYTYNSQEDDRYGKFIPLVVFALLLVKRRELTAVPKAPWWPALALVVAGLLLHMAGYIIQQTRISILAFFLGLYGLTGLVWGPKWLRATLFPYFLFLFCFPLGTLADRLTIPLRTLVTHISVAIAHLLGVEAIRNGTQIIGATGFNFDVAPACSGIRSLTALTVLTTIYGFLTFRAAWKRMLMVCVAVPLAIIGNVARITGVILTSEAFGEQAGVKFHEGAGFITFFVAIICVMALGHWLREDRMVPPIEEQPA